MCLYEKIGCPHYGVRLNLQEKSLIRKNAITRRASIENRGALSERIWTSLRGIPEYQQAGSIFAYASASTEVETICFLEPVIQSGKRVALPFCSGKDLHFFGIDSLDSLAKDAYGILAPNEVIRAEPSNQRSSQDCDLILIPGLAFTPHGARLGYGAGYYDRFLSKVPPNTIKIGLSFSAQILSTLPEEPLDIRMDIVISENDIFRAPLPPKTA